jgi:hypothetical protein
MSSVGKIPGLDSDGIFHDVGVGIMQRAFDIWSSDVEMFGVVG